MVLRLRSVQVSANDIWACYLAVVHVGLHPLNRWHRVTELRFDQQLEGLGTRYVRQITLSYNGPCNAEATSSAAR